MGAKLFLFKFQNPNAIVLQRMGNIRAELDRCLAHGSGEESFEPNMANAQKHASWILMFF